MFSNSHKSEKKMKNSKKRKTKCRLNIKYIIISNVNGPNTTIKRQSSFKNMTQLYAIYKKLTSKIVIQAN